MHSRLATRGALRSKGRFVVILAAALLALPTVVAAAKQPPGPADISGTAKGLELKAAAAGRFVEYGVDAKPLKVLDVGGGTYVVVPSSLADVKATAIKQASGKTLFSTEATVGGSIDPDADPVQVASLQALTAAAPYWQLKENGCFATIYDNAGYFDTCYKILQLMNDGIPGKTFYNLQHWGTAHAHSWQTIDWAEIWSDESPSSATMTWSDWGPRNDIVQGQGTCTTYGVNVGVVVSVFIGITACERNDMTKYPNSDPGHYKMRWDCNCLLGVEADRSVEYSTEITIPSGGPLWVIGASFDG